MAKLKFGTDEWVKALHDELNASSAYAEAGKTWEGDFYFVVDPEGPGTEPVYMYMDLWHGKSRGAHIAKDKSEKNPAFVISGAYSKWKKVVMAQLDPIQAMMTGQLKIRGNMVMIMKHVKAAQEMVKACTRIDTEFSL
ncbi:MAG: SCP2 sterol-binding domain-containing protein [Chloroflexota bacterium]|nr:SCP2 sterol-binding domain-containing protein [Chloroflexota bacterium]